MQLEGKVDWGEVFHNWEKREAKDPVWTKHAKEKGFSDWQSWRGSIISKAKMDSLNWRLFNFDNPTEEIPAIIIGPFPSWQAMIPESQKNQISFEEFLKIPKRYESYMKHLKVISIMDYFRHFDGKTICLMGFIREEDGKIVCVEGHHTTSAYTLAKMNGYDLSGVKIKIFLAERNLDGFSFEITQEQE